jgi:hypothetical protein
MWKARQEALNATWSDADEWATRSGLDSLDEYLSEEGAMEIKRCVSFTRQGLGGKGGEGAGH